MLTHRLATLLFRAWKTGQPAADLDRGMAPADRWRAPWRRSRAGHHAEKRCATATRCRISPSAISSAISPTARRPPEALVAILSAFFGTDVHVEEFIPSWLELEPEDCLVNLAGRLRLWARAAVIGSPRAARRAAKFRLRVGALSLRGLRAPAAGGGISLQRLAAIVRNHVGDTFDWDVNLVLKAEDVPAAQLGA